MSPRHWIRVRASIWRLAKLGMTVIDGSDAKVTAVTRDAVRLADGRELPSEVTVRTVGFGVPDLCCRGLGFADGGGAGERRGRA